MNKGNWVVKLDGSYYWDISDKYETKDEAIRAGIEDLDEDRNLPVEEQEYENQEYFEIRRYFPYVPAVCASQVIDNLIDHAYEECGESTEYWLEKVNIDEEDMLEMLLSEAFLKWAEFTNKAPHFGNIENIETIHYPRYKEE